MHGKLWRGLVAGALLALLAAACGEDAGAGSGGETADAGQEPAGGYGDYGDGKEAGGGAAAGTLSQVDFSFSPADLTVISGDTITVSNDGSAPHTFTVEDISVTNQPGDAQDVTIDLAPGEYGFVCTFHERSGMVGTLTVT